MNFKNMVNTFYLRLKNQYLDINDVENPFKFYALDEPIKFSYGFTTTVDVYIKKIEYYLSDSIFGFGGQSGYFLSFDKIKYRYSEPENYLTMKFLTVNFKIQNEVEYYERSVYTVFQAIAEFSGLYDLFFTLGLFTLGYYNQWSMIVSMLNDKIHYNSDTKDQKLMDKNSEKFRRKKYELKIAPISEHQRLCKEILKTEKDHQSVSLQRSRKSSQKGSYKISRYQYNEKVRH